MTGLDLVPICENEPMGNGPMGNGPMGNGPMDPWAHAQNELESTLVKNCPQASKPI